MSIHPSLNIPEKDKKHRSVLKRSERLKAMIEKGSWKEGDRVYGLPKVKTLKIKIKKEKAEKPQEGLAAGGGAAGGAGAAEAKTAVKATPVKAAPKEKNKK
ncbi:MAG: small basic protein [Candidatus Omnitrophota bacterium]